jgi:hypothetical protein
MRRIAAAFLKPFGNAVDVHVNLGPEHHRSIPEANLCEDDQMVLGQTQASPVLQGNQKAPFRGQGATISEEKIPHSHTHATGEDLALNKKDLGIRLEAFRAEAGMMMSRAEDMERRLDETTKPGSAASVASAELKGELSSLQASSRAREAPDRSFLKSSLYSDFM